MRDRTLVVFHYAERASDAPQQLQLRRRNLEYFLRIGVVDDPRVHFILNLAAGNVTEAPGQLPWLSRHQCSEDAVLAVANT